MCYMDYCGIFITDVTKLFCFHKYILTADQNDHNKPPQEKYKQNDAMSLLRMSKLRAQSSENWFCVFVTYLNYILGNN